MQGEQKSIEESFRSLVIGYPLALLAIFVIIASAFRSYAQPFLLVITIPFGFIGCLLGHLALGYDLSIMSVMGMVALSGVIINDSIVLLDRINNNLARGLSFPEAVREAVTRRLRPIFLTTVTTVVGITPLIFETDFQARMIVPMAISLAGGLMFSTMVDLILMPSLLGILNDLRRMVHRLRHGEWPAPEAVEPSRRKAAEEIMEPQHVFLQPQK
jgi:multidrug efflux pump subunit AcrB